MSWSCPLLEYIPLSNQKGQVFLQLQPPMRRQGATLLGKGNCVLLVRGACEPCQTGKGTSGMVSFMSYGAGPPKRSFKSRSDCLTVAVPEHLIALCWNIPDYTNTALSLFTPSHRTPAPYSSLRQAHRQKSIYVSIWSHSGIVPTLLCVK